MFTKTQRNRLQELSAQVLGNEYAYTKLIKDPQFQVCTGFKEVVEKEYLEFVPVAVKKGKQKFQAVRRTHPTHLPLPTKKIPVLREMTFEEIEGALLAASEMKGFQAILEKDEGVFYETLVAKYKDGTIINKPFLHVLESSKPEFDTSFGMLPKEQQDVLKPYVVPNAPKRGTNFVVDGVKFVDELVYQNSHEGVSEG